MLNAIRSEVQDRPSYISPGGRQLAAPGEQIIYPGDVEMALALGLDSPEALEFLGIQSNIEPDESVRSNLALMDDDYRCEIAACEKMSDDRLLALLNADGTCWLSTEAALAILADRKAFRSTVAKFGTYSDTLLESIMDPANEESATCREAAKHVLMGRGGYWKPWVDEGNISTAAPIPAFVASGWARGIAVMSEAELTWALRESDGLAALDVLIVRELMHRSGGAFTLAA